MYQSVLKGDSGESIDLGSMRFWTYDDEKAIPVDSKNVSIVEGDVLSTTCVYDTLSKAKDTEFGLSTFDEMCLNALGAELDTDIDQNYGWAFLCEDGYMWSGELDLKTSGISIHDNRTLVEQATDCWTLAGSKVDCAPLKARLTVSTSSPAAAKCCTAKDSLCLACARGVTVSKYCADHPGELDCPPVVASTTTTKTESAIYPNGTNATTNATHPQTQQVRQTGVIFSVASIPQAQGFLGSRASPSHGRDAFIISWWWLISVMFWM